MSWVRFMRVFVMFDLPVDSSASVRVYNKFRKALLRDGFFMFQKSIYTKLVLNSAAAKSVINRVKNFSPEQGVVFALVVTEKQFTGMDIICGSASDEFVNCTDKVVIL